MIVKCETCPTEVVVPPPYEHVKLAKADWMFHVFGGELKWAHCPACRNRFGADELSAAHRMRDYP